MTALLLSLAMFTGQLGSVALGGVSTWYDYHQGQAAAGPALREALGPDWRGSTVTVSGPEGVAVVRLTDACWCRDRGGKATLIDLDDADFINVAGSLGVGVVEVSVELGGIALPATDTLPERSWDLRWAL